LDTNFSVLIVLCTWAWIPEVMKVLHEQFLYMNLIDWAALALQNLSSCFKKAAPNPDMEYKLTRSCVILKVHQSEARHTCKLYITIQLNM
jgi:serine protease inhibitor ecotin